MTLPELQQLAGKVRELGFQGIDVKEQPESGIQAGGYFFPASELDRIDVIGFFVNGMFAEIVALRDKTLS